MRFGGCAAARTIGEVRHRLDAADFLQHFGNVLCRAAEVVQHPVNVVGAGEVVRKVGENVVVRVDFRLNCRRQFAFALLIRVEGDERQAPVALTLHVEGIAKRVAAERAHIRRFLPDDIDLLAADAQDGHAVLLEQAQEHRAFCAKLPELHAQHEFAGHFVQQGEEAAARRPRHLDDFQMVGVPVAVADPVQQGAFAQAGEQVVEIRAETFFRFLRQ